MYRASLLRLMILAQISSGREPSKTKLTLTDTRIGRNHWCNFWIAISAPTNAEMGTAISNGDAGFNICRFC